MDLKIKNTYRAIEFMHMGKEYKSLAKSISLVLEDDTISNDIKIERIGTYINDYYSDLNYVDESEYL